MYMIISCILNVSLICLMQGMFQNTVSFTGKNVDQMNTAEVTSMMVCNFANNYKH